MAEHLEYTVEDVTMEKDVKVTEKKGKIKRWLKKYAKPLALGVITGMVTKGVTNRVRMNKYIYGVNEYSRGFNDGSESARLLLDSKYTDQ